MLTGSVERRKIIIVDVDGTLLERGMDGLIAPEKAAIIAVFNALHKNGYQIFNGSQRVSYRPLSDARSLELVEQQKTDLDACFNVDRTFLTEATTQAMADRLKDYAANPDYQVTAESLADTLGSNKTLLWKAAIATANGCAISDVTVADMQGVIVIDDRPDYFQVASALGVQGITAKITDAASPESLRWIAELVVAVYDHKPGENELYKPEVLQRSLNKLPLDIQDRLEVHPLLEHYRTAQLGQLSGKAELFCAKLHMQYGFIQEAQSLIANFRESVLQTIKDSASFRDIDEGVKKQRENFEAQLLQTYSSDLEKRVKRFQNNAGKISESFKKSVDSQISLSALWAIVSKNAVVLSDSNDAIPNDGQLYARSKVGGRQTFLLRGNEQGDREISITVTDEPFAIQYQVSTGAEVHLNKPSDLVAALYTDVNSSQPTGGGATRDSTAEYILTKLQEYCRQSEATDANALKPLLLDIELHSTVQMVAQTQRMSDGMMPSQEKVAATALAVGKFYTNASLDDAVKPFPWKTVGKVALVVGLVAAVAVASVFTFGGAGIIAGAAAASFMGGSLGFGVGVGVMAAGVVGLAVAAKDQLKKAASAIGNWVGQWFAPKASTPAITIEPSVQKAQPEVASTQRDTDSAVGDSPNASLQASPQSLRKSVAVVRSSNTSTAQASVNSRSSKDWSLPWFSTATQQPSGRAADGSPVYAGW